MDNRTHFVIAADCFQNTDDVLFTFESLAVLTHEQNSGDVEASPIEQWNEDGVMADFQFSVDNTKNVVINSLVLQLVATDGTTEFALDTINVNLTPNAGFPPIINTNETRNYILPTGAEFNLVQIVDGGTVASKTFYDAIIGQKITWQEWLANANVPAIFIDLAQQNDGLNQKADNYSNVSGYDVHLRLTANVTGDDATQGTITNDYTILSNAINVYDYFESDDGVIVSGTIETFDSTDTYNLNGSFLPSADTLFKTTWVGSAALAVGDVSYVIHRIEIENAPSNLEIEEISTLRGAVVGGKLENISIVQDGANLVSTCTIKAGSLTAGNWKLSARIKLNPAPVGTAEVSFHFRVGDLDQLTYQLSATASGGSMVEIFNALRSALTYRYGATEPDLTLPPNPYASEAAWLSALNGSTAGEFIRLDTSQLSATNKDLTFIFRYSTPLPVGTSTFDNNLTNKKISVDTIHPSTTQIQIDSGMAGQNVAYGIRTSAADDYTDFPYDTINLTNLNALNAALAAIPEGTYHELHSWDINLTNKSTTVTFPNSTNIQRIANVGEENAPCYRSALSGNAQVYDGIMVKSRILAFNHLQLDPPNDLFFFASIDNSMGYTTGFDAAFSTAVNGAVNRSARLTFGWRQGGTVPHVQYRMGAVNYESTIATGTYLISNLTRHSKRNNLGIQVQYSNVNVGVSFDLTLTSYCNGARVWTNTWVGVGWGTFDFSGSGDTFASIGHSAIAGGAPFPNDFAVGNYKKLELIQGVATAAQIREGHNRGTMVMAGTVILNPDFSADIGGGGTGNRIADNGTNAYSIEVDGGYSNTTYCS
jgi:hypothetical protein